MQQLRLVVIADKTRMLVICEIWLGVGDPRDIAAVAISHIVSTHERYKLAEQVTVLYLVELTHINVHKIGELVFLWHPLFHDSSWVNVVMEIIQMEHRSIEPKSVGYFQIGIQH